MIIGGASSKTFERKEKSGATMEPVKAKWIKWSAIFDDPCYGFRAFIIDSLIVTFYFGPLSVREWSTKRLDVPNSLIIIVLPSWDLLSF